jgi:putative cardiolipin synthase
MSSGGIDLAAVIAELAERLPPGHVGAWARVLRTEPSADARTYGKLVEARLIEARPGMAIGSAAARLVGAWEAASPPVSGAAVALALESAAHITAETAACRSDVVISGPASDAEAVRLTSSVISELIHHSSEHLLIVSFAAFGVSDVVRELELALRRGVRIDLVLEGTTDQGGTLHGPIGADAAFESIRSEVSLWSWPANRRPVVGSSRAALHAKLVAADERVALLGSDNLTDRALVHNLELGVIIRDPGVVRRMVRHFRSLMMAGSRALERVTASNSPETTDTG